MRQVTDQAGRGSIPPRFSLEAFLTWLRRHPEFGAFAGTVVVFIGFSITATRFLTPDSFAGILTVAPILGGWLLEATSYAVLFGLTTILVGIGFGLTLTLPPPASALPPAQETEECPEAEPCCLYSSVSGCSSLLEKYVATRMPQRRQFSITWSNFRISSAG